MAKRPKKKRGEDWERDTASLAGRITTTMEERGLKPSDLAAHCKVSVTAVGWWLRGETKNLKLEYFFALSDKLNVEPRWLGINEGPKKRADVFDELQITLDRARHSTNRFETTVVTDSTKPAKSGQKDYGIKKP